MASSTEPSTAQRTGRRSGDSGTREAILVAAREHFAKSGYAGASLRTIAGAAGVDPALIRHFFGSKDDLFAATLEIPPEVTDRLGQALESASDGIGEALVRAYLGMWEDPASAESVRAMVRSAIASDKAADRLRGLLGEQLHASAPLLLDRPDGRVRAALIGSHLIGIAVARYLVRVDPIAALDLDTVVTLCTPAIQRYLTAPLPLEPSSE